MKKYGFLSMKKWSLPVWIFSICFYGCDIINPDETIPSYLYIDTFTFSCSPDQGYPSSKITDGWVYANNVFIGAYELPATIPVLSEGETDIIVYAGIKENGISGTGMIYPFYNGYTITKTMTKALTDSIFPSTIYKPTTAIKFVKRFDFNIGNDFNNAGGDVTLTTTTSPDLVFEGAQSGMAVFTGDADTLRTAASGLLFPTQDHLLFLEMDYKSDVQFEIWVTCHTNSGAVISDYVLTITKKDFWNKIYVNLNTELQFFSQYDPETYDLEIRAIESKGTDTATLYIDNLKIIQSI